MSEIKLTDLALKLREAFFHWAGITAVGARRPATWAAVAAVAEAHFAPTIYTVEFEELRAGQTAAGVTDHWFPVVELFDGRYDNPLARAVDRVRRLGLNKGRYRCVSISGWSRGSAAQAAAAPK